MATAYTSLLGLALPVTGELSGTWGDVVNNYITSYVDASVAGAQTISGSQTAVTLSTTNGSALSQAGSGATGSAQYQIINCTGNPASLLTVTAPATSKQYIVLNSTSTSQSVKIVGAGPTTGVTVASGEKALLAWNGSDFVKVSSSLATGDVVGPASATDNAIARFDGTTGKLIQNSAATVADTTGDITAGKYNKVTITAPATGSTLTIADGKTLTANNTLTFAGTDSTTMTFPSTNQTIAGLAVAQSFTALQTFTGSTSVLSSKFLNAKEAVTVSATSATGTINYDVTTQSVIYYTSNAGANWTVNFRASSGTSLDSAMSNGESVTVAFLVTQGGTAYYNSAVQVDGNSVTPKWQGGAAPTAGNASSIDAYVYTIVKTSSATFTVFASQTQFA